ncbi:unnamed protein product [Leptosia nina]|uniref:ATR-interacting protein n=1 Tax=Leptosia nina TaxID=320188 RepID=A0AAV1J2W1_9NEOP
MSKRYFPEQYGERKKAKLDVTVSDHNFPLSQNPSSSKANNISDNWGDDNDDEILLLASQACEEIYNEQNISNLPDYSVCMQPGTTSTQYDSVPSTSKTPFSFKKPTSSLYSAVSTNLRDKYERISSPLPGITSKINNKEHVNLSDDLIINDRELKGQNTDQFYKQLLQLKEENSKLKSENGKLLEKCVTKEGEASILRTQLKTCQMSVDNARLEKIKVQEKAQMEWMEKLGTANKQLHDLRTQLDFKNLEIISIKEKCKMLESSKIKLTQVTVGANDTSISYIERDNMSQKKRVKTICSSVQTEKHAHFLQLNKIRRKEISTLKKFLPLIMEAGSDQNSLLEYNEKLKRLDAPVNKCRIFSTFHRLPSTPSAIKQKNKINITSIYEDLMLIASGECGKDTYLNITKIMKDSLNDVHNEVSAIAQRLTTAFQKEMDEKYIESTTTLMPIELEDLVSSRELFKEEQVILARRLTTIFSILLQDSKYIDFFKDKDNVDSDINELLNIYLKLCIILDTTSTGVLYSGFLKSVLLVLQALISHTYSSQMCVIVRSIIQSRPAPIVSCAALPVLVELNKINDLKLCAGAVIGNLRLDYDQGVLLYRKDSCLIQVLLKQVETALKCIELNCLVPQAVDVGRNLLLLYTSFQTNLTDDRRCDCQLVLMQVIVFAVRICANALNREDSSDIQTELMSVCRSGIQLLYQCVVRDVEFVSQLSYYEGHLIGLCEVINTYKHSEIYTTMLSEISSTYQSSPEDMEPSFTQPWIDSFETFSIVD